MAQRFYTNAPERFDYSYVRTINPKAGEIFFGPMNKRVCRLIEVDDDIVATCVEHQFPRYRSGLYTVITEDGFEDLCVERPFDPQDPDSRMMKPQARLLAPELAPNTYELMRRYEGNDILITAAYHEEQDGWTATARVNGKVFDVRGPVSDIWSEMGDMVDLALAFLATEDEEKADG